MANISMDTIKELRERTGVGIVQIEKPLVERIGLAIRLYLVHRSPFRRVEVRQKRHFGNIRIDK